MPTISSFYGISIRMFFNDHVPPHFHVEYAEFKATVDILELTISSGKLPRKATAESDQPLSMRARCLGMSLT